MSIFKRNLITGDEDFNPYVKLSFLKKVMLFERPRERLTNKMTKEMSPEHNEDGETYPGKRFNKKPPRQPSPEELKRMPINQIADLIRETRNYYWPHEAGEKKK